MFSVSSAELLTIVVVALLVFGPRRLPEIARKAGHLLKDARDAAGELRRGVESEYREVIDPLRQAGEEVRDAVAAPDSPPPPRVVPPPGVPEDRPPEGPPGE